MNRSTTALTDGSNKWPRLLAAVLFVAGIALSLGQPRTAAASDLALAIAPVTSKGSEHLQPVQYYYYGRPYRRVYRRPYVRRYYAPRYYAPRYYAPRYVRRYPVQRYYYRRY